MKTLYLASSIFAASTAIAFADGHAAPASGYALSGGGSTLLVMADLSAPEQIVSYDLSSSLDAIAWRPVTGALLGITDGMVYQIETASGDMTDLRARFDDDAMLGGDATAFDFNNQIDAVRAVSSDGVNLVYFPDGFGDGDHRAGSVLRFTDLAYDDGDANAGMTPMIFANAYTNAVNEMTASETFQYAIDAETDALVSLANNAGILTTIGAITVNGAAVDLAPMGGFDILSPAEGDNTALAILQMTGAETAGLYTLDLNTGAATLNADLGVGGITGFAASLGM